VKSYLVKYKYSKSPYKNLDVFIASSPKEAIDNAKSFLEKICEWDERDFIVTKFRAEITVHS